MTRRTIVPLLVAAFALVALPAHAAPWQQSSPRDAFDGTVYLYSTASGEKRGLTDRVDCQVVSRFAGPLTVYAPMELARTR
jgi:hypothetical protein